MSDETGVAAAGGLFELGLEGAPSVVERSRLDASGYSALLEPHEKVRDPIHGDIAITALERALIDTEAFQRLRHIQQLGPCSIVYPGATHTRFAHSLGTLFMAEHLSQIADANASLNEHAIVMGGYERLLIRLTALLHDVAHIPYGHTLEDEGNLYDPEWDDRGRVNYWLGGESEIGRVLTEFIERKKLLPTFATGLLEDIRTCLTAQRADVDSLEFPYVVDIVSNTLCADLLDYAERDSYYCGLRERTGDRFVSYAAVLNLRENDTGDGVKLIAASPDESANPRLVLLAYRLERDNDGEGELRPVLKRDVLSEAMDLLRHRFSLAEKVYFHRTKIAASSMLISAVGAGEISAKDLYSDSDGGLLERLNDSDNLRTRALAEAYAQRRLYKQAFRIDYKEELDGNADSVTLWTNVYPRFRTPAERLKAEAKLEGLTGLPPGSISIYCPDKKMNLKRFEMYVQVHPRGEVKKLGDLLDSPRRKEMDALDERFRQLWALQLFVDPAHLNPAEILNPTLHLLNGLCESDDFFGLPNDITKLRGSKGRSATEVLAENAISEWEQDHPSKEVPHSTYNVLIASQRQRDQSELTAETMRQQLDELMKPEDE